MCGGQSFLSFVFCLLRPSASIVTTLGPGHRNLRAAVGQLFGAVAQSAHTASPEQQQRIVDIVNNARREIYQILGESE